MITIAWDIDDVLNDLMREWLKYFKAKVKYESIVENSPHKLLDIKEIDYQKSLDQYRLSGLYDQLKPVKEVKEWFEAHGSKCRHIVLTSVPAAAAHISAAWVMKNFGTWIRSFNFVPSSRPDQNLPLYDKSKGAYLKNFGKVDLFIDDAVENIESAKKAGIKTLVFPRPWNQSKMTIKQLLEEVTKIL